MAEDAGYILLDAANQVSFFAPSDWKPKPTIQLTSPDGRSAVIDFGGEAVTFEGELPVSEAAKIFFEAVGAHLVVGRQAA